MTSKLDEACRPIRMILSDVDGVLTDGGILYTDGGAEIKQFNARDGFGVRLWHACGGRFGIVTGRRSEIVERRAVDLAAEYVRQGILDKITAVREIAEKAGVELSECCFIGDDFPDLAPMKNVGLSATVADAPEEIRAAALWISSRKGGDGALRELIETILKAQNRWNEAIQLYA